MKRIIYIIAMIVFLSTLVTMKSVLALESSDNNISVKYQSHVQSVGWQNWKESNSISGTVRQSLRLEAFKLTLENAPSGIRVRYKVHVQDIGWQDWKYGGEMSGTQGLGLRSEAISIELVGAPKGYHIEYQVHVQERGWMDWKRDGQIAGTEHLSLRIEAIRVRIVKDPSVTTPAISYKTHVQNVGWQNQVSLNQDAGLPGRGLNVEAFSINISNIPDGAMVKYQSYVQNVGWQNWVSNGKISGTTGKSLGVEAIRIKLEGLSSKYHIMYRVYVTDLGWQSWVKDGEIAGSVLQSRPIEAITIKLVNTETSGIEAIETLPKFSIDIGHNVENNTGAHGIRFEDELTMEVGTKVIQKLRTKGYTVIETKPSKAIDNTDSLRQRVAVSNNNEVDKFVSIHFNAFNSIASGTEVFYYYVSSAGKNMALNVVNEIADLGYRNRGAKDSGGNYGNLYVLRYTDAPAILVECAFVDSAEDMKRYNAEDISNAIVRGLLK